MKHMLTSIIKALGNFRPDFFTAEHAEDQNMTGIQGMATACTDGEQRT